MAAGFKYNLNPLESEKEMCRFETVYRYSGGFNLVTENLVEGSILPPLAPLALDFSTRKATVVKNVLAVDAINDTELKIQKGSLAYVGMHIGTGSAGATISAIDKSNKDYDTLTLSATIANVKKGQILFESGAAGGTTVKNKAIALNYAWTKVEAGATVTAIGQAYEIRPSKLIVPIADKDKDTLGDRFMFTL